MDVKIPGLYTKHGRYYYQPPQKNGVRPKPIALRTDSFQLAIQKVDDIKRQRKLELAAAPMSDLIEEWLTEKRASGEHSSDSSSRTGRAAMKKLQSYFPREPHTITAADVESWKRQLLQDEKRSPATVASYMAYCQSFYTWLIGKGRAFENPVKVTKAPRHIPTRRKKACTREERDRLIYNCTHLDLKAVLYVGFHTGMRRQEILNLRRDWITCDDRGWPKFINVPELEENDQGVNFETKDRDPKIIPITNRLAKFLVFEYGMRNEPYLIAPQYEPGNYMYRWEYKKRLENYVTRHGLPWVGTHTFRHTFVTLLLSAPPDKRPSTLHIARWTGTNEETLRKSYAHLFNDLDLINAAN